MSVNDPISDMLTRIRNAGMARKAETTMPSTKVLVAIAKILKEEGYIGDFRSHREGARRINSMITLRYGADKKHCDPRDQAGQQAGSARLRRARTTIPACQERIGDRHREHPAGGHDRLRGPTARNRRRGALHRLLVEQRDAPSSLRGRTTMSRIGHRPMPIPAGVEIDIADDNAITVKGPKGALSQQLQSAT